MLSPSLFTPQAWQDALEIVAYIGTDNPEAASRFVPALEDTCTQLVALPGMGSIRTFQRKDLQGVRIMPVTGFEHYLRPCTCTLRINIPGLPADRSRGKKA